MRRTIMIMKTLHLMAVSAVVSGVLIFAAARVDAQQRAVGGGARNNFPSPVHSNAFSWERGSGFHGGFGNVWVVEREVPVIVEREVVREVAVPVAAPAPAEPRKPYVIGASYASLPGGCMKLIDEGTSFFYCSGEWYRQVGEGRSASYRAVARKL